MLLIVRRTSLGGTSLGKASWEAFKGPHFEMQKPASQGLPPPGEKLPRATFLCVFHSQWLVRVLFSVLGSDTRKHQMSGKLSNFQYGLMGKIVV